MIAPAMPAGIEIMAGFGGDGVEHEITLGTQVAAESGLGDGGRLGIHGYSSLHYLDPAILGVAVAPKGHFYRPQKEECPFGATATRESSTHSMSPARGEPGSGLT